MRLSPGPDSCSGHGSSLGVQCQSQSQCSHRHKIPIFSSRCEKQGELYHTTNIIQRFSVEVGRLSHLYNVKPLKSIKIWWTLKFDDDDDEVFISGIFLSVSQVCYMSPVIAACDQNTGVCTRCCWYQTGTLIISWSMPPITTIRLLRARKLNSEEEKYLPTLSAGPGHNK